MLFCWIILLILLLLLLLLLLFIFHLFISYWYIIVIIMVCLESLELAKHTHKNCYLEAKFQPSFEKGIKFIIKPKAKDG